MELEPFIRMLLAAGLAFPVGLERELRGKAAGLRTHVVVATASAALGYLSVLAAPADLAGTDRTRIAAQVVSGIGFMGAGVIFAAAGRVHGLTTAAALWGAAAIGLCVGMGEPVLGLALVLVTLLFLWPIDRLSDLTIGQVALQERTFQIVLGDVRGLIPVQRLLAEAGVRAREFTVTEIAEHVSIQLVVRCRERQAREVLARLQQAEEVRFVSDEALSNPDG